MGGALKGADCASAGSSRDGGNDRHPAIMNANKMPMSTTLPTMAGAEDRDIDSNYSSPVGVSSSALPTRLKAYSPPIARWRTTFSISSQRSMF